MTGRATFGDFAREASRQLDHRPSWFTLTAGHPAPDMLAREVHEFSRSLDRLLAVIGRYCGDAAATFGGVSGQQPHPLSSWARASVEAHDALRSARGYLAPASSNGGAAGQQPAAGSAAHRLDAATMSLAAGRDLLHTHLHVSPGRFRLGQSEWAPVVTSMPVTRALLAELAGWARQIAPQASQFALSRVPARPWLGEEQRKLNAASRWLWALASAVETAQRQDPVLADDIQLLHAIPASMHEPRRLPGGAETITDLCRGTTGSAGRVRHAARNTGPAAAWSPHMTGESLSQAATCATVISHHCHILLQSLAARAGQHGSHRLSSTLAASADTAARARAAWINAARAWYQIQTDTRGAIAPAAAEAADLALWTGRLAYASPLWTLDLGPAHATRPPETLAPEPADLGNVLAAVHQATATLTALAAADYTQIRTAGHAGRLLVPTRSLTEAVDNPHPFARAPADRVTSLLATYRDAGRASVQATADVSAIAADIRAPSAVLTWAHAATHAGSSSTHVGDGRDLAEAAVIRSAHDLPGPVQRRLQELGTTSHSLLVQGAAIDQAARRLILEAAQHAVARPVPIAAGELGKSADTAQLINQVAASGSPNAAALVRQPDPAHAKELEAER